MRSSTASLQVDERRPGRCCRPPSGVAGSGSCSPPRARPRPAQSAAAAAPAEAAGPRLAGEELPDQVRGQGGIGLFKVKTLTDAAAAAGRVELLDQLLDQAHRLRRAR